MGGKCRNCINIDKSFIQHLFLLSLTTFCVVLPIFYCRSSASSWFSEMCKKDIETSRQQMRQENDQRLAQANKYLNSINFRDTVIPPYLSYNHINRNVTDVGITIISVSRNRQRLDNYQPKYLTQTVAYFLHFLNNTRDLHVTFKLFICDVDRDPSSYLELHNLSRIVPTFQRFPFKGKLPSIFNELSNVLEKEKQDYVYCGQQTLKQNMSYVFLVEDDALPHTDLLYVVDGVVKQYRNKTSENIAYIKFYHPDRLLGYISLEAERIPELVGLSLILTSVLVFVYRRLRHSSLVSHKTLWIGFLMYSFLLFLVIGRQSLLEFRRFSRHFYQITPSPSCCTPAILYPKKGMEGVVQYLKTVRCRNKFGKDMALDQYLKNSKLKAKLVQPNLFTHIGMYSSLRNHILDPNIV